MILQFGITGFEWILGLGIMFALAMIMNMITYKNLISFFIWLTIFNSFMVWANMLPLWTLIMNIIILTMIIFFQFKSQGVSEQ